MANYQYLNNQRSGKRTARRAESRLSALRAQLTAARWRLQGYLRLTLLLALSAATPGLLLPLISEIPVYNYYQPPLGPALLLIPGSLFLIFCCPRGPVVLFAALITSGALTNTIIAQLTAVADYFLIPGTADHYFNLPDAMIFGAIIISPLVMIIIYQQIVTKGKKAPGPATIIYHRR